MKTVSTPAFGGAAVGTAAYVAFKPEDLEATLARRIKERLDAEKQNFFDQIHPIGTATSIKVHDVKTFWKTNNPKKMDELVGFNVRYTIYWEGPIQKDGYTKLTSNYDAEIGRFTAIDVLETNGLQNKDIANGALAILDACLQAN